MDYYANHCRLCRTSSSLVQNWPNLLSAGNEHLLLKIQECTNVRIHESDKLPKKICDVCQINLDQAYSFRLQCEQANERLQFELDFLEKNDWDTSLPIPAMEHTSTGVTNDVEMKIDIEVPPVTTVYIKPELEEDFQTEDKHYPVDEDLNIKQDVDDTDDFDRSSPIPEAKPVKSTKKTKRRPRDTDKRFQCSSCSRSFSRKCRLREHEVRHSGVRNVDCPKCKSKFFTETDLKSHLERVHSESLPYECDKCCKGFPSKGQLTNHMTIHLESRDFCCDICSKNFKTKYHLKVHMESHLPKELRKEKKKQVYLNKYICQFCGKISNSPQLHKRHIRTHTGELPYECHICNKRFTTSGSRNDHVRGHSDVRPFQCEHCQKAFRLRHHRVNHIRSAHTGERPFQCKYCERTFVTRGNMRLHERVHGEPKTSGSIGNFSV